MTPEQVPAGALLLDTDVVSWIALREERWHEYASLLVGHQLFVSHITVTEIGTLLHMGALADGPPLAVVTGNLRDFSVLAEASRLVLVHPDLDD